MENNSQAIFDDPLCPTDEEVLTENDTKILVQVQGDMASALKEIIAKAKEGDRGSLRKLEAFQRYSDPQLASRVALMNNKQRRAFEAARRGKKKGKRR